MANSSDDVDLVSEVEDVRKELIVKTGKHLEPIDMNDAYYVLEGLLGKFTTSEQRVEETVKIMARKIQKLDGIMKEKNSQNEDSSSNMQEEFSEMTEAIPGDVYENAIQFDGSRWFDGNNNNEYLKSLIILYPDVDRQAIKRQVEFYGSNWKDLQSWMIANVEKQHERKRILAISSLQLTDQTKIQTDPLHPWRKKPSDKVKSQCPECESWKIVKKGETVAECEEVACGINYCLLCNKKDHRPFECRKNDEIYRNRAAKDTNNIFKPLLELPTSQKDGVKRYVMFPKNDMDWTNPLDILYMAGEATFLRMVDRSPKIPGFGNITRKSILSIEYIENQSTTASFLAKQDNFLAKGINSKERLCFHGTPITNIDNILRENFSDQRIKRCAYGRGHYFSEFPNVSAGYGAGLLLCRVLLGTSWEDSSREDITESNSKLVKPDEDGRGWAIVVPDSQQILPAFVIKLREDDSKNIIPAGGLTAHSAPYRKSSFLANWFPPMAWPPQAQNKTPGVPQYVNPMPIAWPSHGPSGAMGNWSAPAQNKNPGVPNWRPMPMARSPQVQNVAGPIFRNLSSFQNKATPKAEKRPRRNSDPPPTEFIKQQRVEPAVNPSRPNILERFRRERQQIEQNLRGQTPGLIPTRQGVGPTPALAENGSVPTASRFSRSAFSKYKNELIEYKMELMRKRNFAPDPDPGINGPVPIPSGSAPSGGSALQAFPELMIYSDSDEETATLQSGNGIIDRNEKKLDPANASSLPGNGIMDSVNKTMDPSSPAAVAGPSRLLKKEIKRDTKIESKEIIEDDVAATLGPDPAEATSQPSKGTMNREEKTPDPAKATSQPGNGTMDREEKTPDQEASQLAR